MFLLATLLGTILSGYELDNIEGNYNYTRYSTLETPDYLIDSFQNLNDCFDTCNTNNKCLGVSQVTKNTTNCYTLSNLGQLESTPIETYSYRKTTHYQKEYGNYTIHGQVDYASDPTHKSTFVYIDSNLNGVYDDNEYLSLIHI